METKPNVTKIIIVALLVIAIIIIGVILMTSGKEENKQEEKVNIATESEFENMKVKDVQVEYKSDTNITVVKFKIENLTNDEIKKQTVNAMLLDEKNVAISGLQNYIEYIAEKRRI